MAAQSIVFMFSGQGSQYFHMAKGLYRRNPVFTGWLDHLDNIVTGFLGKSVIEAVFAPDKRISDPFDDLALTHPAIVMWEYALARVMIEDGFEPDFVLGTSLGEYTAAAVSGVLPVEEILRIIVQQAEIVYSYCPPGSMLTILDTPELFHRNSCLRNNSELASINYDSHFVVSGAIGNIETITSYLKTTNITHQILPVRFAFHSSLVDEAEAQFAEVVGSRYLNAPCFRYISGTPGKELRDFSANHFWNVVRQPMHLPEAIRFLESSGSCVYVDLGPSGTNANFVKHNLLESSRSVCFPIITPFGGEAKKLDVCKNYILNSEYAHL